MVKHKVSELQGALLDYWVASAEGMTHPPMLQTMRPGCCLVKDEGFDDEGAYATWVAFQPSTDWKYGGPIISKNAIAFAAEPGGKEGNGIWRAYFSDGPDAWEGYGETHLIAAMRAYVASKFGDEVPDA